MAAVSHSSPPSVVTQIDLANHTPPCPTSSHLGQTTYISDNNCSIPDSSSVGCSRDLAKTFGFECSWPSIVKRYAWELGILLAMSGIVTLLTLKSKRKSLPPSCKIEVTKGKCPFSPSSLPDSDHVSPLLSVPEGELWSKSPIPLTLYSSLVSSSETIRRSVSWPDQSSAFNTEEFEAYACARTSYGHDSSVESLKSTSSYHVPIPTTSGKKVPIEKSSTDQAQTAELSSDDSSVVVPPASKPLETVECKSGHSLNSPGSKLVETVEGKSCHSLNSAAASKLFETVECRSRHSLNWSQVKMDLFLLFCILSFLIYFFCFCRQGTMPKQFKFQPATPFPSHRLFP